MQSKKRSTRLVPSCTPCASQDGILVRKCYDQLRRRRPEVLREDSIQEAVDEDAHVFLGTERDGAVLEAVAALPEEQRLVIVLRFYLDLTYADIEAVTGWPAGTVKSRISRSLGQLRESLAERSLDRDV